MALGALGVVVRFGPVEAPPLGETVIPLPPPPPPSPTPQLVRPEVPPPPPAEPTTHGIPVATPPPAPVVSPKRTKPAPGPGTLQIVTRNCSMEVSIEGKPMGNTPMAPLALAPGTYRVRLEKAECEPPVVEETVTIKSGLTSRLVRVFPTK
jgi:hypothetical protein